VLNASGHLLSTETDPAHTVEPAADAPLTLSEADLAGGAQEREASLHATLVAAHYAPHFGGTAELVVEPDDPASFVQTIGRTATALLDHGAYLITIVDSAHDPCSSSADRPASAATARAWLGRHQACTRTRSSAGP
jgi:hypothetical protein